MVKWKLNVLTDNFVYVIEAVKSIVQLMGMQPCERSDKVPENKSSHTLIMAGVFRGRSFRGATCTCVMLASQTLFDVGVHIHVHVYM